MKVYLVGYMYSGKTTVGRHLAAQLGMEFMDLDQAFEQKYKTTIPIFFKKYGEPLFRQLESKLLQSTADLDNVVVSTGGGTPCYLDNMARINQLGVSVYLDVPLESILQRMAKSRKQRPILAGMTLGEKQQFVSNQLQARQAFYRQARLSFPAADPDIAALAEAVKNSL